MAASTFPAHTYTNDTGTPANPNGDGTLLNNADLQVFIGKINQMFAGGAGYDPFVFGGGVSIEKAGDALGCIAGPTGAQNIFLRNTAAGTSNLAQLVLGNDGSGNAGRLRVTASNFTPATVYLANAVHLTSDLAGGLVLAATHASGGVKLHTRVSFGVATASIGSNQTDYNLGGTDALVYIITPTANNTRIDGITGGYTGRTIILINGHASNVLIVGHNTGSGGNGVLNAAVADSSMAGRSLMMLVYDGSQWISGQKS